MQLYTKTEIKPFTEKIDHTQAIFSIGSCFAENMAGRLRSLKFNVTSSPTGILFNPESIALALERLAAVAGGDESALPRREELLHDNGVWFNYDFHSSFSDVDADTALERMRRAVREGAEALKRADTVIITLGSAMTYQLKESGQIVANCHKQPQRLFQRELLDIEYIAERYIKLCTNLMAKKRVIFTISPIRHLSDGLEGNSLSKAILRVALNKVMQHADNVAYFPSYEIMIDELRDYRFYADDMAHPTSLAINYIWERFAQVAFSHDTSRLISRIEQLATDVAHRPLNPTSEAHKRFCAKSLETINELETEFPKLDFSEEKIHFSKYL